MEGHNRVLLKWKFEIRCRLDQRFPTFATVRNCADGKNSSADSKSGANENCEVITADINIAEFQPHFIFR